MVDKMKPKALGLRQAIAKAETKESVNDLLVIGTQYENASEHTKRRWANTARKRLRRLLSRRYRHYGRSGLIHAEHCKCKTQ